MDNEKTIDKILNEEVEKVVKSFDEQEKQVEREKKPTEERISEMEKNQDMLGKKIDSIIEMMKNVASSLKKNDEPEKKEPEKKEEEEEKIEKTEPEEKEEKEEEKEDVVEKKVNERVAQILKEQLNLDVETKDEETEEQKIQKAANKLVSEMFNGKVIVNEGKKSVIKSKEDNEEPEEKSVSKRRQELFDYGNAMFRKGHEQK